MFELVKSKIDLLTFIINQLGVDLKMAGDDTYAIENEEDYGGCPFCHHNGCFKIKYEEEVPEAAFYHCFSCETHGSVIDWYMQKEKLTAVESARRLAKEYNIDLPNDYSPIQEIFNTAANYYITCLNESGNIPQVKLSKMTPIEYQTRVRKHSIGTLQRWGVGWSDGGLIDFLEALGYEDELLVESGLKNKKTGRDFLPFGCFIYPHSIGEKVSHFTFKDPEKKLAFQMPNKNVLNGIEFYMQNQAKKPTVIIVEGENDALSTYAHNPNSDTVGVIATIGQISGAQLEWLRTNMEGKNIITMFDPDDAGDKYRVKVEKLRGFFKSLIHIYPPNGKDIDDLLSNGEKLDDIISKNQVQVTVPNALGSSKPEIQKAKESFDEKTKLLSSSTKAESSEENKPSGEDELESEDPENKNFLSDGKRYFKVKWKEGQPQYIPVSNFTAQLKNVYLTEDGDRIRELIITRADGYQSEPVLINSETKTSLRNFRTFLARASDADFTGSEQDLIAMWRLIYSAGTETLVRVSKVVGRHEKTKGWILNNKYISDALNVIDSDPNGIFWLHGRTQGIKPELLDKSAEIGSNTGIPQLNVEATGEQRAELITFFLENLSKNLGDMGPALLLLAWMNAVAYSNTLFHTSRGFPMLFMWSLNGKGKGTIGAWLMSIYDMMPHGKTTIAQLRSGVGFARKAEYYASLPLWIDEVRADEQTKEYESLFRTFFDREGRTMGNKEGGTITVPIRACVMFSGEDQFQDPATRERCVTVRLPSTNRETVESYQAMESRLTEFSAIGYDFILNSVREDTKVLSEELKALDMRLITEAGCTSRKSKLWSIIGVFALRLGKQFVPEYDIEKHLFKVAASDSVQQKSETTLSQFFERVESIVSQEGIPKITYEHMKVENIDGRPHLHMWFAHIYRMVVDSYSGRFPFSRNAILSALREEPYFVSDDRKLSLGLNSSSRRLVVTLDLTKASDTVKNIADTEFHK